MSCFACCVSFALPNGHCLPHLTRIAGKTNNLNNNTGKMLNIHICQRRNDKFSIKASTASHRWHYSVHTNQYVIEYEKNRWFLVMTGSNLSNIKFWQIVMQTRWLRATPKAMSGRENGREDMTWQRVASHSEHVMRNKNAPLLTVRNCSQTFFKMIRNEKIFNILVSNIEMFMRPLYKSNR